MHDVVPFSDRPHRRRLAKTRAIRAVQNLAAAGVSLPLAAEYLGGQLPDGAHSAFAAVRHKAKVGRLGRRAARLWKE